MTDHDNQDWLSADVELRLQELQAQRARAEELFRGYSADLDDDNEDDEI